MPDSLEKFIRDGKIVKLTVKEKVASRSAFIDFLKNHPVSPQTSERQLGQRLSFYSFVNYFLKPMPLILIIMLLIGGGTSFAAEGSVPGDLLYPVKVNVNEEVRGWLSASQEAKADWETERVNRRLEEAEELAKDGKLDAQARATIEQSFAVHADRVNTRITEFEERSDFKAASNVAANFETSLAAHERILTRLGEEKAEARSEVEAFMKKVRSENHAAGKVRIQAETSLSASMDVQAAAQGKAEAAKQKIATVRRFLENKKSSLGEEATAKGEARLALAEELLLKGNAKLEAGAWGEAFVLFGQAFQIAQEGKLLIEARGHLQLNVSLNGFETRSKFRQDTKAEDDTNARTASSASETSASFEESSEVEAGAKTETELKQEGGRTEGGGKVELKLGL